MTEKEILYGLIMRSRLTERELEVLQLMPNHNYKEVAGRLGIGLPTVKNIQHQVYIKFEIYGSPGACKRLKAVLKGIELGIIDLREVKFRRMRKSGVVWV